MNNNNALTAMTGGITRPQTPQIINLDSGTPLPKRQAPATPTPSVNVSLSDSVTGNNSKGQQLTEKYEQTTRELFPQQQITPYSDDDEIVDGETGLFHLAPLSLPTKADAEAFEKLFTRELGKAGVDTSIPIKLKSDGEGGVIVTNDHPDKNKIEALFKDNPDLQQGFVKTETYTTLQKIYQLHQQWLEKINGGMSEEAAGNWLVSASKSAVANAEITFTNGKIAQPAAKAGMFS